MNLSSRDFSFGLNSLNVAAFINMPWYYSGLIFSFEFIPDDERNRISNNTGIRSYGKVAHVSEDGYGQAFGDQKIVLLPDILDKGGLTWAAPRMAAAASRYLRDKGAIQLRGAPIGLLPLWRFGGSGWHYPSRLGYAGLCFWFSQCGFATEGIGGYGKHQACPWFTMGSKTKIWQLLRQAADWNVSAKWRSIRKIFMQEHGETQTTGN
ncbi:hypothetical protein F5Y07DRAFT_413324 [Xylaria sp. FL0933]|nr:hypothetical protein F5Y07DRAFT_413324 [Xylaria sp. FL0933]